MTTLERIALSLLATLCVFCAATVIVLVLRALMEGFGILPFLACTLFAALWACLYYVVGEER